MAAGRNENVLNGMKAICQYYGRSENTILKLNQSYGFPIKKCGGGWQADRRMIDQWQEDYLACKTAEWIDKFAV